MNKATQSCTCSKFSQFHKFYCTTALLINQHSLVHVGAQHSHMSFRTTIGSNIIPLLVTYNRYQVGWRPFWTELLGTRRRWCALWLTSFQMTLSSTTSRTPPASMSAVLIGTFRLGALAYPASLFLCWLEDTPPPVLQDFFLRQFLSCVIFWLSPVYLAYENSFFSSTLILSLKMPILRKEELDLLLAKLNSKLKHWREFVSVFTLTCLSKLYVSKKLKTSHSRCGMRPLFSNTELLSLRPYFPHYDCMTIVLFKFTRCILIRSWFWLFWVTN